MNPILIKVVPHSQIRNDDVTDWKTCNGVDEILVSILVDIEKPGYALLVAIHELVEKFLCDRDGITDEQVTAWDATHKLMGDDPRAPYHKQHNRALGVEQAACAALGYHWESYDRFINCVGIDDSQLTCAGVDKER